MSQALSGVRVIEVAAWAFVPGRSVDGAPVIDPRLPARAHRSGCTVTAPSPPGDRREFGGGTPERRCWSSRSSRHVRHPVLQWWSGDRGAELRG